jgi:hypothetical protein
MKTKGTLLLIATLGIFLGCKNETRNLSPQDLNNLSKIKEDSIYIDENGNKWTVRFNSKIAEVNNTINGTVKYSYSLDDNKELTYDKYGNIYKSIFKETDYNDIYKIQIYDDSLKVGEVFTASLWAKFDKFEVEMEQPKKEVRPSTTTEEFIFEFPCSKPGTYSLIGKIKSDSSDIPFEYKFIVK